jgi:hypothetical protein
MAVGGVRQRATRRSGGGFCGVGLPVTTCARTRWPWQLSVGCPARRKVAQPLCRLVELLAPADSEAEQKRGQRRRRPRHAMCHVARQVKHRRNIRIPAIKPQLRAGRFSPLIEGVHEPNHNGCRKPRGRAMRTRISRRHLAVPCGPLAMPYGTPSRRASTPSHRSLQPSQPQPPRCDPSAQSRALRRSAGESQSSHGGGSPGQAVAASRAGRIGAKSPCSDRPR